MYALIFHKDFLFTLSKNAKALLQTLPTSFIPSYPLWAFTDDNLFEEKITGVTIGKAVIEKQDSANKNTLVYFPVEIAAEKNTLLLKVVMASSQKSDIDFNFTDNISALENTKISLFRIAEVNVKHSTFSVTREKWIRTK